MTLKKLGSALCGYFLVSTSFAAPNSLPSEITCGLKDISAPHLQSNSDSTGWGLPHQAAVRKVVEHIFLPAPRSGYDFSLPLSYLDIQNRNAYGRVLTARQLDLLLCTQLGHSSLERTQDFEGAGFSNLSPNAHFLFHLRWQLEPQLQAHGWFLVNRLTGATELVSLDD